MLHKNFTGAGLHVVPHTVADAAARAALAATYVAADVGRFVYQLDDDTLWVCTAAATLTQIPTGTGSGHVPVTLAASADAIMDLTGQELSLEAETANTVFAGPTAGGAAVPDFRALVAADVPDLTSVYRIMTQFLFTVEGELTTGAKPLRIYVPCDMTIDKVFVSIDTAPTGASVIVDVNKNGATIFTNQANRPEVADGANTDESGVPDVTALAAGDYLTMDVDQIGSTTPGEDMTVHVRVYEDLQATP